MGVRALRRVGDLASALAFVVPWALLALLEWLGFVDINDSPALGGLGGRAQACVRRFSVQQHHRDRVELLIADPDRRQHCPPTGEAAPPRLVYLGVFVLAPHPPTPAVRCGVESITRRCGE